MKFLLLSKRDLSILPQYGLGSSLILSSAIYGLYMAIGSQMTEEILLSSVTFTIFWLIGGVVFEKLSQVAVKLTVPSYS